MIYSTATVPVNPDGESPLTRAQAWAGLVLKARDARLFLPPGLCTRCDVVEESATHIVREATIGGNDLREIISFEQEKKVTFFQSTGPREGAILNELFEDEDGALQLRFYCYLGLRDKQPGGPDEMAEQAGRRPRLQKRVAVDAETDSRIARRGQALISHAAA
ncbi:AtaL-like protein [Paraburkholderia sp. XV]|uniref:AtaL-like protein n=1 Tax=Paraburkholderia sp. XV TaxID=2831520 RepID=UPI001CD764B3|nr:AtaL-like protein [Paraburkholderia sp. XV]